MHLTQWGGSESGMSITASRGTHSLYRTQERVCFLGQNHSAPNLKPNSSIWSFLPENSKRTSGHVHRHMAYWCCVFSSPTSFINASLSWWLLNACINSLGNSDHPGERKKKRVRLFRRQKYKYVSIYNRS